MHVLSGFFVIKGSRRCQNGAAPFMENTSSQFDAVTVTFNPAIDRTLTIPNFRRGAVNRVNTEHSSPGGKGVNVASALAARDFRVAVTGFLGRENTQGFEEFFESNKIEDRFVRIDGSTRTCIKIEDVVSCETTDINFPGLQPTRAQVEALTKVIETLDARWFVLSGSLPPGLSPSIFSDSVTSLKARGCRVAVDTSGEPLARVLEAKPALVKPNIHELEALLGRSLSGEQEVVRAARQINAPGIEMVVVSMGGAGACFVTTDDAFVARPPRISVRSTVGAGDAMVAGIVAAQLKGLELAHCARLATAFSVATLAKGDEKLPVKDLEEWMRQVEVTPASC